MIFMAGISLSMIPGRAGELIKSELLKIKFDIPRSKSVSIVIIDRNEKLNQIKKIFIEKIVL